MANWIIVHDLVNGFPAAVSGTASFYLPNTASLIVIAGDDDGTAITNPVSLDSNGSARVYLDRLARMIVQDASGLTVFDGTINGQQDTTVTSTSSAFTGATVEDALNSAQSAFGGQDFQYVPSGAWVGMSPKAWLNSAGRNILAYGTVGATQVNDGVTPADSAMAAAIADAQSSGGARIVLLPAGTYLLNSTVAINTTGVTLQGAGAGATTLKINSGTNDGLVFTSANGSAVRGMRITATAATTGKSINVAGVTGFVVDGVKTDAAAIGLYLNNTNNVTVSGNSSITGSTVGIKGSTAITTTVLGGTATVDTTGGAGFSELYLLGVDGAKTFDSSSGNVVIIGGTGAVTAASEPTSFYMYGGGLDGTTVTQTLDATVTPDRNLGPFLRVNVTVSGKTMTVNLPTPTPARRGVTFTLLCYNNNGGATTWTLNAGYHKASAISTTAGDLTTITFMYDLDAAVWREVSRVVTT